MRENKGFPSGIGCALVFALVVGSVMLALGQFGRMIDNAANERAAVVDAQSGYVIAAANADVIHAAADAVRTDTRAAHSRIDNAAPWFAVGFVSVLGMASQVATVAFFSHQVSGMRAEIERSSNESRVKSWMRYVENEAAELLNEQ